MRQDTDPKIAARYHELSAALAPCERLRIAAQLSQSVRELALAGVRQRYPDASFAEVRWRFTEVLYGTAVATRVFGALPSANS